MAKKRKWLIPALVGVAVLGIGGYAYAKSQTKIEPPPSPRKAVKKAIKTLGPNEKAVEIADVAYTMAYPKCPPKLDPDDPTHESCIRKWLKLRDIALEELAKVEKTKEKKNGRATVGPAKEMRAWIDSLSQNQRTKLRQIIKPKYYDPIKQAADAGDDGATVSAVLRLERAVRKFAQESPVQAMLQLNELENLLGPKLDELMKKAKKYS